MIMSIQRSAFPFCRIETFDSEPALSAIRFQRRRKGSFSDFVKGSSGCKESTTFSLYGSKSFRVKGLMPGISTWTTLLMPSAVVSTAFTSARLASLSMKMSFFSLSNSRHVVYLILSLPNAVTVLSCVSRRGKPLRSAMLNLWSIMGLAWHFSRWSFHKPLQVNASISTMNALVFNESILDSSSCISTFKSSLYNFANASLRKVTNSLELRCSRGKPLASSYSKISSSGICTNFMPSLTKAFCTPVESSLGTKKAGAGPLTQKIFSARHAG
mmetsp:Transcript_65426/g.114032  ORF Transcript_65426/g.114032 Transcript_65426/m.114032 type:complete len:271 (+) Transcript_65426:1499-2311(+)